jgi:hypothetical protein
MIVERGNNKELIRFYKLSKNCESCSDRCGMDGEVRIATRRIGSAHFSKEVFKGKAMLGLTTGSFVPIHSTILLETSRCLEKIQSMLYRLLKCGHSRW